MSHAVAKTDFNPAAPDTVGLVHSGTSPIVEIVRTCRRIAGSEANVLLTGETGTGKEVFARLLHAHSGRTNRQFVPVNCGAIPEALLESELFGFVRGAFTGAISARRGRVALAEGGTLFLDEVGELPLSLQVKLLRLLQERTYEPVGSSESVTANFRLIAATNRDLEQEVRAGRFRRDLYYRLHVCPVALPALRDRREDIAPLFTHFWRQRGEQRPVSAEAMRCLEIYSWPGNVRELENLVERLSVCSEGRIITPADLPAIVRGEVAETEARIVEMERDFLTAPTPTPTPASVVPAAPAPDDDSGVVSVPTDVIMEIARAALAPAELDPGLSLPVDLPRLLRELETSYIAKALAQSGGNKKEAAKLLGMGRTTLVEKLRRRNTDASGL